MSLLFNLLDKLYLKQWSIGIAECNIADVIRNKKLDARFHWIPVNNKHQFFADPFVFQSGVDEYSVLFEEYDYKKQYGKISLFTLDDSFRVVSSKTVLDTGSHLSYPNIFIEEDEMYVFPEASKSGKLSAYRYDGKSRSLIFKQDMIGLPVVDATMLKYRDTYWMFCTLRGDTSNTSLHIFYCDRLFGNYVPHPGNPVIINKTGARPAGNLIEVDGTLYRPSQNSDKYYGSSISMNKVVCLSEKEFREEPYMSIEAHHHDQFNFGIHTINVLDGRIVIDALRRRFLPKTQLFTFFRKNLKPMQQNES